MTPTTTQPAATASMSLWEIDAELQRLAIAASEEVDATGSMSPETKAALDTYCAAMAVKADRIAEWMKHQKTEVAELKEEKDRVAALYKAEENALERFKAYFVEFCEARGIFEVKGKLNRLKIQNNSQDSLKIEDPMSLPDQYTMVTVKLPTDFFLAHQSELPIIGKPSEIEPNGAAIRAALCTATEVKGCEMKRGRHVRIY